MIPKKERLKDVVRRFFQIWGLELRYYYRDQDPKVRRLTMMRQAGIDLVLDVGANIGQYATALRVAGYTGRIVSFEPLSQAFRELVGRASSDPIWECQNLALSDREGTTHINITADSYSSSLLSPLNALSLASATAVQVAQEEVTLQTLDGLATRLIGPNDRVWLKIDVQGNERRVIEGGLETLKRVVYVEMELSRVALYEGQPLMPDMMTLMDRQGFELVSLEPGFCDPSSGHVLQFDGVFMRRGVASATS